MIQAGISKLLANLLPHCTMNLASHSLSVLPLHSGVGRKGAGLSRAGSSMLRSPETSQVSTPSSKHETTQLVAQVHALEAPGSPPCFIFSDYLTSR
jgi:hypothetical protein